MGDLIKLPSTHLYLFYGTYHILPCWGFFKAHVLSSLIDCELSEGWVWALYLSVIQCGPVTHHIFLRQRHHHHHHHHHDHPPPCRNCIMVNSIDSVARQPQSGYSLSFPDSIGLNKSLNFFVPHFSHPYNGGNNSNNLTKLFQEIHDLKFIKFLEQ